MEYVYAVLSLLAGLGCFLVGCRLLSDNMEKLANTKLRALFAKTNKNKVVGVGIGCASTAIVQSSGLTTVMVVGFVNAGIMSLYQATAVIMGANIGTTITAQIAALQAFKIGPYFMCLAGIGVFITMFAKSGKAKLVGNVLAGLGLVFVGLEVMSNSMTVVKESEVVMNFISNLSNPLLLFLVGIIFTAIVQSSSVITSILISMASAGIIIGSGGNSALYIILGTNIGSCGVALISSIGANTNAKRASFIHLLFNVAGALIFFIVLMCWPSFNSMTFEKWFAYPATQIAMFHTFFNVLCTILFLPFANIFVKISMFLIKDKEKPVEHTYLEKRFLSTPAIAIQYATKESMRMLDSSIYSLELALDAFIKKDSTIFDKIIENNNKINITSKNITDYLIQISSSDVTMSDEKYVSSLHTTNGNIVRISELADNLIKYTERSIKYELVFSDNVKVSLNVMLNTIKELDSTAQEIMTTKNFALLPKADQLEDKIDNLRKELIKDHIDRLNKGECRAENSSVFINLVCNLERVGDHLSFVAHSYDSI